MLPFVLLNMTLCLLASLLFRRPFRPNSDFKWNAWLGSLAFLAMWFPLAVQSVLAYEHLSGAVSSWVIIM